MSEKKKNNKTDAEIERGIEIESKEDADAAAEKAARAEQLAQILEGENGSGMLSFLFEWAQAITISLVIVLLVLTFFCRQVTVNGTSMNNTLQNKDRLLIETFMYEPQDGDIIVATHGVNYPDPIVKRVIATAGQKLQINYDTYEVIVDGKVLDESAYIIGRTIKLTNPLDIPEVIPEGYVFAMGDNREGSLDSRSAQIGLIPVENIIGKAVWRILPAESFGEVH